MPQTKSKTDSRLKRDKRYDKVDISNLPKDLLDSMREITLADDGDLIDLVNSAIAGREVTNEIDDLREWCEDRLAKNTVIVAATDEEYYDIVYSALLSLPNQHEKGVAKQKRGPIQMLAQKTGGYLVEFGVQKRARQIGIEIQLAHQLGETEQFLDSDFPNVVENGKLRKAKINIGAKSGLKNAVWLDVPASQFSKTDFQIFGRSTTNGNHLDEEALKNLLIHNPHLANRKYPQSFLEYKAKLIRKPISVYLVGFASKPESANAGFSYDGYRCSKIFHITEMSGIVPSNYEEIVREKSDLPESFKIEVLCIERFTRHEKGSLCVWNSGSIAKTIDEIDELIRKL